MITKTKTTKLDFFNIKSSALNKQNLIYIAKKGKSRPKYCTNRLGRLLSNYTIKSSSSYDPEFAKTIKRLRPDWFVTTAEVNKKKLIELAKKNKARPKQKTRLGQALCTYVNKNMKTYDAKFVKIINKLNKSWLASASVENKKVLLNLAKKGEKRPTARLGWLLSSYVNLSGSSYDDNFSKTIRGLRPDWFFSKKEVSKQKKEKLIKLAKNGCNKPTQKTDKVLSNALREYTYKPGRVYDPNFDKIIRKIRPDWFVKTSDLTKKKLIQLAKSGLDRPSKSRDSKLLHSFRNYTYKSSMVYDHVFTKTIKKIRPDWFKKFNSN